jgi:hypothetical protein
MNVEDFLAQPSLAATADQFHAGVCELIEDLVDDATIALALQGDDDAMRLCWRFFSTALVVRVSQEAPDIEGLHAHINIIAAEAILRLARCRAKIDT